MDAIYTRRRYIPRIDTCPPIVAESVATPHPDGDVALPAIKETARAIGRNRLRALPLITQRHPETPAARLWNRPTTSPSGEPCRQLPKPVTRDKFDKISYPGVGIDFINYSLTYSHGSDGPFAHIEVSGQISGRIPPHQHLYPFGWSDPATTDSTPQHHSGNGLQYWGKSNQIFPDDNGCWSQLRRKLGYSGAQGVTFRHYYGLISDSDLPCPALERLSATNKSDNGLDLDQLTRCGVNFLGYITIPTKRL